MATAGSGDVLLAFQHMRVHERREGGADSYRVSQAVDPTLRETAAVYGIGTHDRLLRVTLPAAAPQIFAGMRTALSLALILMVISEMVASSKRIGYFVLQSQRSFAIPEMWSGIVLLAVYPIIKKWENERLASHHESSSA